MSKSAREIQEDLYRRGHIDASNQPLNPSAIYVYLYANGVSGPEADAALGWRIGTCLQYVMDNGLAHLTGDTGVDAPPPHPPRSEYGSGFEGTPADPAGPTTVYGPEPTPDPVAIEASRKALYLAYFEAAGWDLPGDELPVRNDLPRLGVTAAEAERWLNLAPGSLDPNAPISAEGGGGPPPIK